MRIRFDLFSEKWYLEVGDNKCVSVLNPKRLVDVKPDGEWHVVNQEMRIGSYWLNGGVMNGYWEKVDQSKPGFNSVKVEITSFESEIESLKKELLKANEIINHLKSELINRSQELEMMREDSNS